MAATTVFQPFGTDHFGGGIGGIAGEGFLQQPFMTANFRGLFEKSYRYHENLDVQKLQELRVCVRGLPLLIPESVVPRVAGGDARLANMRRTLDSLGLERSKNQRTFHRSMTMAVMPHIYGDEYDIEEERLLRDFGVDRFNPWTAIQTPRREGKSTALCMMGVAVLWTIPFITQVGYSTGRRASMMNLENTVRMLQTLPGAKDRILKCNHEQLWIRGTAGIDDVRQMSWYPSREDIGNARLFAHHSLILCCCVAQGEPLSSFFYYFYYFCFFSYQDLLPFPLPLYFLKSMSSKKIYFFLKLCFLLD